MLRATLLACAFVAPLVPFAPAPAQETMDEATFAAKVLAARGVVPRSEREQWTIAYADGTGTYTYRRRGDDYAFGSVRGGLETSGGRLAGRAWRRNENGILRAPKDAAAAPGLTNGAPIATLDANEAIARTSIVRVHAPIDAWERRRTYVNGDTAVLDADPQTFRVLRSVDRAAGGDEEVRTYADYRTVEGVVRPFVQTFANGEPSAAERQTLAAYTPNADVADAELAIPTSSRCPFAFPAGTTRAPLPARMIGRRVFVRMTIGDRGYDFQLDTGASGIFLGEDVAHRLGLAARYTSTHNADGRFVTRTVVVPSATFGALTASNVVMDTIPAMDANGDIAPAGLIGYDLLGCVDVRLDYDAKTVEAIDPAALGFGDGSAGIGFEVDLSRLVPVATIAVDGVTSDEFVVDTGADGPGIFFTPFAERYEKTMRRDASTGQIAQGVGGRGFGIESVTVNSLSFGGVRFQKLIFQRARDRGALNASAFDGIVGADLIAFFTMTTDYANDRIILEPGKILRAHMSQL